MPGFLERVDYCLRIGSKCLQSGDPYTWACSVKVRKPGIVEIMGVCKGLRPNERRDIRRVLKENGFRKAFYIRKDGVKKRVWILTR
jgi:hypothetical protein